MEKKMYNFLMGISVWALALVWVLILVPFIDDLLYAADIYLTWAEYDLLAYLPALILSLVGIWEIFLKDKK